jgi:hypothetical protein
MKLKRKIRLAETIACIGDAISAYTVLVENLTAWSSCNNNNNNNNNNKS